MPRTRRFQSMILAFAMVTGVLALAGPAHAVPLQGTASLTRTDLPGSREVISGQVANLTFSVSNTGSQPDILGQGGEGTGVNWVRITPETENQTDFIISNGTASGWTYDTTPQGDAVFSGGSIPAGGNASFSVQASTVGKPADDPVRWLVEVSDNGGQNAIDQTPATPGALTTITKVLAVDSVLSTAPAASGFVEGVTDGTATAGQDNVVVTSTVHNFGTAPLDVTPSLSSTQAGDSIGAPSPASATINPGNTGNTATFDFPVTLSNAVNNRTFTGDASATGADGITFTSTTLATQAAPAIDDVANTLAPAASVSGVTKTFVLSVNKSNIPGVQLDDATSELTFTRGTDTFSAPLGGVTDIGKNAQSVLLTFASISIPGIAEGFEDGTYSVELILNGIDDNGASLSRVIDVNDDFVIDNLMPVVNITLGAPAGQTTEDNQPVVKDGNTLTFGGTIKESSAEGAPNDPNATITDCELHIQDRAGVTLSTVEVLPANCKNDGTGSITGSAALPATGLDDAQVIVSVLVSDRAGNATPERQISNFVLIDNLEPEVNRAVTGCGRNGLPTCEDLQTIRVQLTEAVKGDFKPVDFTVDEQIVVGAASTCTATTWCDEITLTLAPPGLEGPDAKPGVQFAYKAIGMARTRPVDGPKNNIIDGAVDAIDGILPPLPTLDGVSQSAFNNTGGTVTETYGKQGPGNDYYSNLNLPAFTLGGLTADYVGLVAIDTNGSGLFEGGFDQIVAECTAAAATLVCDSTFSLAAGTYSILVTSKDPDGNLAEGTGGANATLETLIIDQTAPGASAFALAANVLTTTLSEDIARGRDFASDWRPFSVISGQEVRHTVTGVSGAGASRDATISPSSPNFTGTVDGIRYALQGTPNTRYRDYAGNYLPDFRLPTV